MRVRPTCAPWFYVRGDVALVGASHLGSNYDLTSGAGAWYRLSDWFAVEVEADLVVRVGELDTQSLRAGGGSGDRLATVLAPYIMMRRARV